MIINTERNPIFSLYYLGCAVVLRILSSCHSMTLDKLYDTLNEELYYNHKIKIHINFFYYTLDWLFIQSLIKIENRKVTYVNRKTNNKENKTI